MCSLKGSAAVFLFLMLGYVSARTDEETKLYFTQLILKCAKTNPVEMSELLQLQKFVTPTKMDTKCLLACAYKAEGSMNDKGMFDKEHGYAVAKESMNGDEKRLVNGKKLADICDKINEAAVSDGEKGCDRAALLFQCVVENAPKLGFKI